MLDHLIIDGYNILYAWHGDKVSSRGAMDQARVDLIRQLESVAAQRDIHCTVVFDGSAIEDLLHTSSKLLEVCFAGPKSSADHVIERMVCERQERCGIVVVTNDHLEGQLVTGWGAHVWSSGMFLTWLESDVM